jgi:glycerophosphoryl diester phosphodiesterase
MLTSETRKTIRLVADDIRAAFIPLVAFNLIVAAVSTLVFSPVLAWVFRRLISSTGKSVLSDMEIAGFLLSPFGISSLVVLMVLLLAFGIFSSAGIMQILLTQIRSGRTSVLPTLVTTFQRLPQISALIAMIVGVALLLAAPFLIAIVLFALPLITEFDINFYLAERPAEFMKAIAIAGVLVLVLVAIYLYLFVGWALALPLMLFGKVSARESLKESNRLVSGRRKEIAVIVSSWVLSVVLISLVLGIVGSWLVAFLMSFQTGLGITAALMGVVLLVNGFAALAVSFIVLTSLNAVIVRVYLEMVGESGLTLSGDAEVEGLVAKIRQVPKIAWWGLGIAAITVIGSTSWFLLKDVNLDASVSVIAHRGSSLTTPENTMAAVNLGLDESADFIEIDVQEDASGRIVVLHDADLKRVAGLNVSIADLEPKKAEDIDIGSWFDPGFSTERLPTLAAVLKAADGKAGVNIELKFTARAVNLTQRVLDVVREADARDRVEFMSLSYDGTQELKELDPEATVGFLSNVSIGNLADTNVEFLAVSSRTATRNFIANAQDAGKLVYVWTVNTPREMALFIDRGVDGIITDAPQLLNDVIDEMNASSLSERLLLRFSNEIGLEVGETEQ